MEDPNAETNDDETITRGTGNVFADLGYSAERVAALREAGVLRAPE